MMKFIPLGLGICIFIITNSKCGITEKIYSLLVFQNSGYASQGVASNPAGSLLYVNNKRERSNDNRTLVGAAEMQAVQGVVSTPQGVYFP